ncbi:MAG: TonB-dependent receptor family protein, partial [Candidatus Azobacteroides sp.]|nr:TonB-dependent receptor family protein [Candidatus Azobacteroides sp.]
RILLTILFVASLATTLLAEVAPDVSVTVKDSKTKEAIGYAIVELLTMKDSVITGGMTNDKGFLTLSCTTDSAKIRIQYLGYKTYEATVANRNLGTILLEEDAQLLKEVTVIGSARTTKVDRDVYAITKEMRAGTSLSRELLGKLNGVIYNPYDQSIMVNGSTNILILIDGIEKDQNMAKTLSPDRIDRVEIIKDPTGKYAADGYRAVINIITKKDYAGLDVNINTNPMFNFTNYNESPTVMPQENSSVNILYTYNKINLYGSYSGNYGNIQVPGENFKRYGDLTVNTPALSNKNANLSQFFNNNNFSVGGDYLLKPDNSLSLELNYSGNENKMTQKYDLTSYLNQTPVNESQSVSINRSTGDMLRTTLTYKGKWNKKSNFEANFRYQHSTPTNNASFVQDAMKSDSYNTQSENFYRVNLDYNYQFTDKFSMDVSYGTILDDSRLYQNNQILKQNQTRNRPGLYLSYAPSQKVSMKAGAMVEFFHQTYQDASQTQTAFLPYVNIQYRPMNKLNITAKYHSWASYPDIGSLSPFTAQTDTLTWSVGNPDLRMSNYQHLALEFNILQRFTIEPFYDFDNGNIQQYLYEKNGQYFQENVNANKYKVYGFSFYFNYPLTKTLFWQSWMQLGDVHLSYNEASNRLTRFQFNTQLFYSLPKWSAMGGVVYSKMSTKNPLLQGYNTWGMDALFLMIQKNFFKNRLSCSLIYMPPVNFLQYTSTAYTGAQSYESTFRFRRDLLKNLMILQINYHFNTGKQIKVNKSSLENETTAPVTKKEGLL